MTVHTPSASLSFIGLNVSSLSCSPLTARREEAAASLFPTTAERGWGVRLRLRLHRLDIGIAALRDFPGNRMVLLLLDKDLLHILHVLNIFHLLRSLLLVVLLFFFLRGQRRQISAQRKWQHTS